jgi:transcriptional regulator with XRE-family HTH domain
MELGKYLLSLRQRSGLTLRQVERATGDAVSNVYLSQLETGKRTDPHPRFLVALAKVYGVPVSSMFEAAGYVDPPTPDALDVAYRQVLADPEFKFGTRMKETEPDEVAKRVIVELYERVTKKKLLTE